MLSPLSATFRPQEKREKEALAESAHMETHQAEYTSWATYQNDPVYSSANTLT